MTITLEDLSLPIHVDSDAFKAAMKAVTATVAAVSAAMGVAIKKTFDWAQELDSIGDVMDVSNEKAAALNYTLRKSGTDTGSFTQAVTILNKGLIDAKGKLDTSGKALKNWGINVLDSNKQLKSQDQILDEVTAKYASFATQQQKVNFLTEVFGKSGATLVDFFDTLAQEGGLDSVTEKVKALGLAIDPGRYEQFGRSLEELKLVGLGLAVQFTEKVMPVMEAFLGWFTDFAKNPDFGKAMSDIDTFVSNTINHLTLAIEKWLSSGGPEELSNKVVSWVENIGKGPDFDSKTATAAGNLFDAISEAFGRIDWAAIGTAIDTKLGEMFSSADWTGAGDAFGSAIETTLTGKVPTMMANGQPGAVAAILQGLQDWFTAAAGQSNIDAFNTLEQAITENLRQRLFGAFSNVSNTAPTAMFAKIGFMIVNVMSAGFVTNLTLFYSAVAQFGITVMGKLTDIAKTFFNAGGKWINQAAAGFLDHKGDLLGAISSLVGEINGILKKIITSFSLSIKLPSWLNLPNVGGGSGGGTTGGSNKDSKRASGGPVIAGQSYNVAEFFRPETFTPTVNGRVDNMRANTIQDVTIRNWSDFDYSRLAIEVIKGMNNV